MLFNQGTPSCLIATTLEQNFGRFIHGFVLPLGLICIQYLPHPLHSTRHYCSSAILNNQTTIHSTDNGSSKMTNTGSSKKEEAEYPREKSQSNWADVVQEAIDCQISRERYPAGERSASREIIASREENVSRERNASSVTLWPSVQNSQTTEAQTYPETPSRLLSHANSTQPPAKMEANSTMANTAYPSFWEKIGLENPAQNPAYTCNTKRPESKEPGKRGYLKELFRSGMEVMDEINPFIDKKSDRHSKRSNAAGRVCREEQRK